MRLGLPSALGRRREAPPAGLVPTAEAVARARREAAVPVPLDDRHRELLAQRERLTERFALLQTDLGGAFYEMAIRDHVQLDVLTRKAAELQRVDAELETVEVALRRGDTSFAPAGACPGCGTPFHDTAQFCSACGTALVALPPLPPAAGATEHHVNGSGGLMGERGQLALLALLSGLATAAVLAGGVGASGQSAEVTAALRVARTTTVALPAAARAVAAEEADETEPPETLDDGDELADAARSADDEAPAATTDDGSTDEETTASEGDDDGTGEKAAPKADDEPAADEPRPTHVKHVFEIVLAGRGFDAAFGAGSVAPYLNGTLRPKGTLLTGASSLGPTDLPDHLALISGQPPNDDTRAGCATYTEIPQTAKPNKAGEITAKGCAYPSTVVTVADQLAAAGSTWRAYVEDLDKGQPPRGSCRRPASGAVDDTVLARPGDGYVTRHNPFVYFHSLLDLSGCDSFDGPLARLETDLAKAKTTPAFSYIVPNLCNDGTASPCADGSPGGLAAADAFLASWVPRILASPAYADGGLLLVTFAGGAAAPAGPEAPVRNGALVVSRFATAGATDDTAIDPYGLLRTVQDVLGLKPLARSADATSLLDTVLAAARIARPGDD